MTRPLPEHLELTDGVITLRPWSEGDIPALTEIWQDGELQRRFGVAPPVTTESITAYVEGVGRRWRDGAQIALAITTGDIVVGGCDLDDLDTDEPDLGYWVAAPRRGQGHAGRAGRLALEWARVNLEADAVLLVVERDNAASIAVAAGLGFRRIPERVIVEDDRRLDVYVRPIER
jgi:RimJ/RimL family protein N-acetyltransferase